jgi:hypothetical protein
MLIGISLALCTGCQPPSYEGPERAPVSGSVTLDGDPVPSGTVYFEPAADEARSASAPIMNGSYSIPEPEGPNLGTYSVRIIGYAKAPERASGPAGGGEEEDEVEEEEVEDEDEDQVDTLGDQIVPTKYNTETTLEVEIVSGANTHDFALTSE